ncbi:MAG: diphthine synthase, partial [Halococcoides sp.]
MLTFVGLGLYDERSVTQRGADAIASADRVFVETYTSRLMGATIADLEAAHDRTFDPCDRDRVERDPAPILDAAQSGDAIFCVVGDPMVATTHVDLRLRAIDRDIETRVIHGTTAQTAASSLTGLQNYRFGPATTIPFPETHDGLPDSVTDRIAENRERDCHTLAFLDIDRANDRYLRADRAAGLLAEDRDGLGVVVARAGSSEPLVEADRLSALAERSFGDPLHMLIVPAELHPLERDALRALAGAP